MLLSMVSSRCLWLAWLVIAVTPQQRVVAQGNGEDAALANGGSDSALRGRDSIRDRHLQMNSPALTITGLDLINALTDQKLGTLTNGQVIVTSAIDRLEASLPNFNINATFAAPSSIRSVIFGHNGNPSVKIENGKPLSFCGDTGTVRNTLFNTCPALDFGNNTVTATPYSLRNGRGTKGAAVTVSFSIVKKVAAPTSPAPIVVSPSTPSPATLAPLAPVVAPTPSPATTKHPTTGSPATNSPVTQSPVAAPLAPSPPAGVSCPIPQTIGKKPFGTRMVWTPLRRTPCGNATTNAVWKRYDDQPVAIGITHAGFVAVGTKFYVCGGYVGVHPGLTTNTCLVLDISKPSGQQWSNTTVPPIPGVGQSGGGLVYDSTLNALFLAGGAQRIVGQETRDVNNTWMLKLDTPGAEWVAKAPIPYKGNHISFVTAQDAAGKERHYFAGGQKEEQEEYGNLDEHYEYLAETDTWVARKSLPMPRGHASSSTRPLGCGYVMIGGTTNGWKRLGDVTYYDIATDSWTLLGSLPRDINTPPVCDLNRNTNKIYCHTGDINNRFSFERQVLV